VCGHFADAGKVLAACEESWAISEGDEGTRVTWDAVTEVF
jgi:hypothetical protein